MLTIWAFDTVENKHSLYQGGHCFKKFCSSLREHATNVINFERKKMLLLTKKEINYTKMQQHVTFVEKYS